MININTNSIDLILINNKENNNVNKELYRVLKPGGYLFGIDKPHKSHNSVCDIEDIGFIIKDSISYFFKENEDVKQDVICLAMKPLSEKNFAENVMKWGSGGLNIDDCRIAHNEKTNSCIRKSPKFQGICGEWSDSGEVITTANPEGRFPANFIIHKDVAPILDKQSGYSKSVRSNMSAGFTDSNVYGTGDANFKSIRGHNDEGGASRYFYNAKSYKDLLRYITVLGLPPKESKVLFIGFDNVDEIIEEINKESNVNYEAITIGGVE